MTSETKEARVLEAIRERRELVNAAIDEELPVQHPERLYEATRRYILEAGGKRLRPTVTTLAAEAVTGTDPLSADFREFAALDGNTVDVMRAAVAIEVIQSFTLIHDDIMDEDDLRRGVPAVHEQYDISTAILAGDTLYSKAFEFMTETGSDPANGLEAMRMLATTCTEICEGQSLDVSFESRDDILPEEYLEMVELKTAVLYGASAATPAVLLGADDDEVVDALYQYGIDSGRAFQIQDDVLLDLTVASERAGQTARLRPRRGEGDADHPPRPPTGRRRRRAGRRRHSRGGDGRGHRGRGGCLRGGWLDRVRPRDSRGPDETVERTPRDSPRERVPRAVGGSGRLPDRPRLLSAKRTPLYFRNHSLFVSRHRNIVLFFTLALLFGAPPSSPSRSGSTTTRPCCTPPIGSIWRR